MVNAGLQDAINLVCHHVSKKLRVHIKSVKPAQAVTNKKLPPLYFYDGNLIIYLIYTNG